MKFLIYSCLSAFVLALSIQPVQALEKAVYNPPEFSGMTMDNRLDEQSGLAVSWLHDDVYWVINDSGADAELVGMNHSGAVLGTYKVTDANNRDWEDLASTKINGTAYILIADIGDNLGINPYYLLHLVAEPKTLEQKEVSVIWTLKYTFPDGPHDSESVMIDSKSQHIYVISKRTKPAVVYQLPFPQPGSKPADEIITAKPIANLLIPQPSAEELKKDPRYGKYRSQPTAADINLQSNRAAVLTYQDIYIFDRSPQQSWAEAFSAAPQVIKMPPLPQGESICFKRDGKSLLVGSEKLPSPVLSLSPSD